MAVKERWKAGEKGRYKHPNTNSKEYEEISLRQSMKIEGNSRIGKIKISLEKLEFKGNYFMQSGLDKGPNIMDHKRSRRY